MEEVEQGLSLRLFKRLIDNFHESSFTAEVPPLLFVPLHNLPLSLGSSKDNFVLAHYSR